MQNKITKPSKLLDNKGELVQKGYALSPILNYNRENTARRLRLKEWDYYLVYNENYAVAMTIGKSNALVLISASFIDLIHKKEITKSLIRIVSDKKLPMPLSSQIGDIFFQDKCVNLSFVHRGRIRELKLFLKDFKDSSDLDIDFRLYPEPQDSMVIATPFTEDKKDFYYNQKIIGMNASGTVRLGERTFNFDYYNTFGLLDWGRGVWPYKTTWYWGAGQGMVRGNLFGFNLGYGFGNTRAATENMLFYNGIASKLEEVVFLIPKNEKNEYEYRKPWKITSSDHRFEMDFMPLLDRSADLNAVVLSTDQHQVFGKFTGTAVLDDGMKVELKDFLGFAERVENRW